MSEPLRAPTPDEKRQMTEASAQLEEQLREALKVWASSVYSIGFAAGVERALGGLVVPTRPGLFIP